MQIFRSRTAATFAAAAALSLTATPAMARDWHRHRDRGVDAGDVFAGLLIVGGIAAIASAASSKARKDRQARADERYRDDYRYDDYRDAPSADYGDSRSDDYSDRPSGTWRSETSVDAAVDACVGDVERGNRSIESIDGVNREGEGWRVDGRVRGGYGFSCSVGSDGRVRNVEGL